MTHIKRLFLIILFAAFAIGTRMLVRYGVRTSLDYITSAIGLNDDKDVAKGPDKPAKAPKRVATNTPPKIPIINQNAPSGTAPGAGPSTPAPSSTPAMGPSAPSIVGPINAARQVASASNKQLAEQTGQETAPVKGARQQNGPGSQQPAKGEPPASQPPASTPPAPTQGPVVQQGAPSSASPASGPAPGDSKAAPKAPPVDAKIAVAPNVKAAAPDTARKPVLRESFDYARDSRRDPFISLMTTSDLRPTITDLRLTGILYDLSGRRPVAILRDVAGGQWRVTTGMTLGRMRVANIKPKVLIFTIEEFGFNRQDSLILGDTTRVRRR